MLPRLQLFEFCDQSWLPSYLRTSFMRCLNMTNIFLGAPHFFSRPFLDWIERHGSSEVLDLASGGGQHLAEILPELKDKDIKITLSDLNPPLELHDQLEKKFPQTVSTIKKPLDIFDAVADPKAPRLNVKLQ